MNVEDRQKIDWYCDIAVRKINIINLWPKLVENKIFNIDDVNISTWKKNFDKEETVQNIWLTIKTRGPSAFQDLLLSLRQSNHEELADLLNNHTENSLINNSSELNNDNYYRNIKDAVVPLQIKVKKGDKFSSSPHEVIKCYQMRSKPRGLVLIITNIDYKSDILKSRKSAIHDQTNLKKLFEEMGFFVETHCDLTGQEIKDCVTSFSKRKELLNVDSCFIIVSSHGNGPGRKGEEDCTEIEGVDNYTDQIPHGYTKVFCSDVINCFTSEACPYLAGKPKIFIFQLCRGNKIQTITTSKIMPKRVTDSTEDYIPGNNSNFIFKKKVIRNYSDMLIAYATLPGHVAFRNNITGSWFILIFCEVFMNHACELHMCDLFTIVDSRLRKVTLTEDYCQTISLECKGFHKYCYINPGVFEQKEEK
ncbi:PREDICTED: caspase-2-like [Polistes canadensis]|uniref:caspase-2-like n=1 Tax=Polistes canadensis TaxID=91411 RepID=UPI000718E53A|nr:PREDICTED: caspase-2-like [Polistes canadensis]